MENYIKGKALGEGSYGEVYEAKHRSSGKTVALKKTIMRECGIGIEVSTLREISLLKSLRSPFVVRVQDVFFAEEKDGKQALYMAMEHMDCDLENFMRNSHGQRCALRATFAKHLCYQILLGLQHCHVNSIIHRDLKPGNVLVHRKSSGEYQVKIADFGMSRFVSLPNPGYTQKVCTRWYRAPEILLGTERYSSAMDVWSVGCIFLQMLLGHPPFRGANELEMLKCIFKILGTPNNSSWPGIDAHRKWQIFPQWPPGYICDAFEWPHGRIPEHLAVDLMNKMFILDPAQRINTLDALNHPYFAEIRRHYGRIQHSFPMVAKNHN